MGRRYLEEATLALRAQTYEDFALIVCDNALTDGTKAIGEAAMEPPTCGLATDVTRETWARPTITVGPLSWRGSLLFSLGHRR